MIDEGMDKHLKLQSKYIAMLIRNHMENFHCKHLSDEQMKELNPLIRDSIYTGLYALMIAESSEKARELIDFTVLMIPKYWEEPRLIEGFSEMSRS
jgi:hypothetical protein